MRLPDPAAVTTKAQLREFGIRLLTKWSAGLMRGRVRIHAPQRLGLMRLLPDMPFHLRPELFLQVSGCTTFYFPEESCRVGPGELCLVSRGLPHLEKVRPWRGPFFNIVISYHPDSISLHLARRNAQGRPVIVVALESTSVDSVHLADLLKNAADWFNEGDAAHRQAVVGLLVTNLSVTLATLKQEPTDAHEPVKVMQARQLIMQHLARPELSVDWVGRTLQSSPDYLSVLFRKSMGTPLLGYITERRMNRARELLNSSTLNISQISRACGYEDPSYFTRLFRRETGLAPRQFRDHALKHAKVAP